MDTSLPITNLVHSCYYYYDFKALVYFKIEDLLKQLFSLES